MQQKERYRAIIDKLPAEVHIGRLEEELSGNPETGALGLRRAVFNKYRDAEAQERLIDARGRMTVEADLVDRKLADDAGCRYELASLEAQLDYLASSIDVVEAQLDAIRKMGQGEGGGAPASEETPAPAQIGH